MTPDSNPRTGPRHEPERVYERGADPAEAADRPLESKTSAEELAERDEPRSEEELQRDPHHSLNTPVGEPDPTADSDPYRHEREDDAADHASGTRGVNQGAEDS